MLVARLQEAYKEPLFEVKENEPDICLDWNNSDLIYLASSSSSIIDIETDAGSGLQVWGGRVEGLLQNRPHGAFKGMLEKMYEKANGEVLPEGWLEELEGVGKVAVERKANSSNPLCSLPKCLEEEAKACVNLAIPIRQRCSSTLGVVFPARDIRLPSNLSSRDPTDCSSPYSELGSPGEEEGEGNLSHGGQDQLLFHESKDEDEVKKEKDKDLERTKEKHSKLISVADDQVLIKEPVKFTTVSTQTEPTSAWKQGWLWVKRRSDKGDSSPAHKVPLDSMGRLPLDDISHLAEGPKVVRVWRVRPRCPNEFRAVKVYI